MAIIKICNKHTFKQTLNYVGRDHTNAKGEKKPAAYTSGILCSDDTKEAVQDFWLTQKSYNKTTGRSAIEIIQSFPKDEKITVEEVHKIGLELATAIPYLQGHQVFIATHNDQQHGNLHNHIVVNAVSLEDGKKIQLPPEALPNIKSINDGICCAHGLSVPAKGKTVTGVVRDAPTANNKDTYAVLSAAEQGGKSYVKDIGVKVITVADVATSRDDFIARLQQQGVGVVWSDARKYIVFEDLCRKKKGEKKYKIRDKKLSQYYNVTISKEGLEDGFKANTTKFTAAERARQQLDAGLDDSFRASQSRKQQLTSGTDSSFQTDTGLSDIRLAAQASTATYAVRERKRRADEEARERFEAARRENFKERKRGAGKGATSQQTNAKYTKKYTGR